jgi:transcription elongation factor Elf1
MVCSIAAYYKPTNRTQSLERRSAVVTVWELERRMQNTGPPEACPYCGRLALEIYWTDQGNARVAALCEFCGAKGYYSSGELVRVLS